AIAGIGIFSAKVQAIVAKKTLNSRVTTQVFQPQNKVQSQGYFEALYADYRGYLAKISIQKSLVKSDPSQFNQENLAGIRQQCVDNVQQYNAAARSIASQAFRSVDLPAQLDPIPCSK